MAMKISDIEFAGSIYKRGGTSSQFLKADGSIDSNTYALNSALSNYLPLSGGTLTNNLTLGNGSDLIISPASSGGNAILYNDIGNLVSTAAIEVQGTGLFSSAVAGYGLSVTNIQDSSQGLLVRSSDNDTTLYLARFQSSVGATSQTWVDRFSIAKNGSTVIGDNIPAVNVRLWVKGEDQTASNYALDITDSVGSSIAWFRNDKAARFYGNVGIGTSPSELFHVYKASTFATILLQNGNNSAYSLYQAKTGNSDTWQWGCWNDNSYRIGKSGIADYMTITSGGRVDFTEYTRAQLYQIYKDGAFRGGLYNYVNTVGSGSDYSTSLVSETAIYFCPGGSAAKAMTITSAGAVQATNNLTANSPSEGNTGEGIIAGRSFKIDASGSGQTAKMYVVSNTLSNTYGNGLQIQFAKLTNDAGFGFNLNTSGGFETYVKAGAGSWNRAILVDSSAVTRIEALRINNLLVEYSKNLTGSYSAGNFYEIVNSSQMAAGIYILRAYVDTYAVGGGTYFITYASVPFYFYTSGTNNTGAQTLPTMIGSGHAGYNPPIIRIRLSPNADGKTYLEFDPNATWTNLTGGGGATVTFNLLRISS